MNINEVEKLTNISKYNIRFYEKIGLIKPKRNKTNDYREYSDIDIETLEKIKLFRLLAFSIEEIEKILKTGIIQNVDEHINSLNSQIESLSGAVKVCERLKTENAIQDLDTKSYLNEIKKLENDGSHFNNFSDDFKAYLNYKQLKQFAIMPDFPVLNEDDVIRGIEEYALANDYVLEFISKSINPKFYLNGLKFHAYKRIRSIRMHEIVCVCDEELVEPVISKKRIFLINTIYFLPFISIIILLFMPSLMMYMPLYVSIPVLILLIASIIIPMVFWLKSRRKAFSSIRKK